jgi:O-antigen/teichoic acid export membrane protein
VIGTVKSLGLAQKVSPVRRRLAGLGVSLFGNLVVQIVGLLTSVLAARLFGPAERGELAAAVAWALIASAVADLGLSQAVPFHAARRLSGSGATALLVVVAAAIVLGPLFLVGHDMLGYRLSSAAMCYSLIGVPFGLAITYIAGLFQGMSRHGTFTTVRIFGALPYAIGLVLSIFQTARSPDRVLWTALAVAILGCAGLCVFAARTTPFFGHPATPVAGTLLRYGLKTYPGSLAWAAGQRVPVLLVGASAGSAALGYYAVAQSYAVIPLAVASAFAFLAPGRIGSKSGPDAVRAAKDLCRSGLLTTWLITIVLLPLSGVVVLAVFGPVYRPSVEAACLLVVASGFLGSNFILSACLRALRRPSSPSYAELGGLVVVLALCPILIRHFGWNGAAAASLAGTALVSVILCLLIYLDHRSRPARLKREDVR